MNNEDTLLALASIAERNKKSEEETQEATQISSDLLELRKQLDEEQKSTQLNKYEREAEKEAWSSEDSLATAQRFFSSMALGWGDELGLWTAAMAASVATGNTLEEVYADMRKDYDQKQEEFKQKQAGAATVADIAGSIASPVNALKVAQAATKAGQAALTGGRVAAESAIYGAGEAGEGQRLSGAVTGAGSGLAGYGVLRTPGFLGRVVSRKNIEGDLVDEAGNFVPITLAAKDANMEGFIRTFYSDVVAPSFGAKGVITKQEKRVIEPIEEVIKDKNNFKEDLVRGSKLRIENLKTAFNQGAKEQQKEFKAAVTAAKETKEGLIAPLEKQLKELNSKKSEEIFAKATAQAKQATDSLEHHFRTSAFIESMPATTTSKDVEEILSIPNIQGQIKKLDEVWSEKGYSMIKDKKIRVKTGDIEKSFSEMIKSDDYFLVNAVEIPKFKGAINKVVDKVSQFKDKNGRIDGSKLAELRSELGKLARASSDPQLRYAFYLTQENLDGIIKKGLTPQQKAQFSKEGGKWKSLLILRNSIEGASNLKGAFSPDDWKKAIDKNNNLDKRYGTGPLRKEAEEMASSITQTKKTIGRKAASFAKRKANFIEKTIENHNKKLKRELSSLEKEASIQQRKSALSYEQSLEREMLNPKIKNIKQEIEVLDNKLAELKQLSSYANPSWFHTLAAHRLIQSAMQGGLGFAAGGVVGAAAFPVAAAGASRALASPTTQRFVAGQTGPQTAVRQFLQADATGRTEDILARSIGRTGLFTGAQ